MKENLNWNLELGSVLRPEGDRVVICSIPPLSISKKLTRRSVWSAPDGSGAAATSP